MQCRTFPFRAWIFAPLLVACATLVGAESLAEVAGDEAEIISQSEASSAGPPIAGLDAILSRMPETAHATAGRGVRIADIENSIIHDADENSERGKELRHGILRHEAVVHAVIRETAAGATILPTSFLDGEEDVVRHARETEADIVVMAFGKPARMEEKAEQEAAPDDSGDRLVWPDLSFSRQGETPNSLYKYALALEEQPHTLFVNSIGNEGVAMGRWNLPFYVSAISNGVAAVSVDANERISAWSNRCGPAFRAHMCIAVPGAVQLEDGAGLPYQDDGSVVHGTSVAAARLAAGLAILKQWLREAEGRDVSPAELLQVACDTARVGPNTHAEVGCGILDLDEASRARALTESTRLVTPTLTPPPPPFRDERQYLPDGSIAIEGEGFDTLNPYGDGHAAVGAQMIYDRLMYGTFDDYQGLIAESVAVNEEEGWIEFVLREEAHWHDGMPITTQDVIWTAETLMAKGSRWFVNYVFEDVERVVETGPRTVRFIFARFRPTGPIAVSRIGLMPVLPKHFWEGRDFRAPIMEPPLGSGQYRVTAVEPGRSVTYEPVENYWARDIEFNPVLLSTEAVTYRYLEDATSSENQR